MSKYRLVNSICVIMIIVLKINLSTMADGTTTVAIDFHTDSTSYGINPWLRNSPIEVGSYSLSMAYLRSALIEQAAMIQTIANASTSRLNATGQRGGIPGLARIVECNGQFGYDSIQTAIDDAQDGDIIVIFPNTCNQDGVWYENLYLFQKRIRIQNANPNDQQLIEATIIDGSQPIDGDEASVIRCFASIGDTVIQGLTLTRGSGSRGGGIYCYDSSPSIWDCRIIDNQVSQFGGGLYQDIYYPVEDGMGEIRRCTFANNTAGPWGGGVYLGSSVGTSVSRTRLVDCLFEYNHATRGGALYCRAGSSSPTNAALIESCRFIGNTAIEGVVMAYSSTAESVVSPTIRSCVFGGNVVGSYILFAETAWNTSSIASLNVENCTVVNNYIWNANTIGAESNSTTSFANVFVRNSIFWSNISRDEQIDAETLGFTSKIEIEFSNFEFEGEISPGDYVIWGEGNISAPPHFFDPGSYSTGGTPNNFTDDVYLDGDYHLASSSPCIDSGDPTVPFGIDFTDFESEPRVLNCRIDMGADEFNPSQSFAGDYNGDTVITLEDVPAFVAALLDSKPCRIELGDQNFDNQLDSLDLAIFVALLTSN